jgi:three-Cys-motif partner protein
MPVKHYDWKDGPAILAPHSRAKHTILREYVERYIHILTRSGTVPSFSLMLIDGFAGGGEYVMEGHGQQVYDGSPFILINAVHAAVAKINGPQRKKPINIDASFVFVEKEEANWAYLKAAVERRPESKAMRDRISVVHGSFEASLDGIISRIERTQGARPRPIFVLDQYGFTSILVDTLTKIMTRLPKAEVFMTIAVDSISHYAQAVRPTLVRLGRSLHIDPRLDQILDGRLSMSEIGGLTREERHHLMLHIQQVLHETFAKKCGALCFTPFFITSAGSNRSYWFLHLANSPRANDVVKGLHWKMSNHFEHFGREGTRMLMLGFDPRKSTSQLDLFDFGESARQRTEDALVEELPAILQALQARYPDGVTLKDLYGSLCNETPADKVILGEAVNRLVVDQELAKRGAKGEEREVSTKPKDSDIIRIAKQMPMFPKRR